VNPPPEIEEHAKPGEAKHLHAKTIRKTMHLSCSNITVDRWERLMKGTKRMNKRLLHGLKKNELP
jgi:hypothetical protein